MVYLVFLPGFCGIFLLMKDAWKENSVKNYISDVIQKQKKNAV